MKEFESPPRLPNFNHLYYFYMTAREGSISAAASKLGVTQPTISEQIKSLERFLGTQLFERRPEGMRLNEAGQVAYEHAQVMFTASSRLVQRFGESAPAHTRTLLRLAVTSTLSRSFAADYFLSVFEQPEVRTVLHYGNYLHLLQDLASRQIDLLLAESKPDEAESEGLTIEHLGTHALVFVAAPEVAAQLSPFPERLVGVPFAHYTMRSRHRWDLDEFLRKHAAEVDVVVETDDIGILRQFALRGQGVTVVPRSVIEADVRAGKLAVLGDDPVTRAEIFAIYHHERPPEQVLKAVGLLRR
jgi:LysR family transcriptional regulator, transcriptional activator of nhaA